MLDAGEFIREIIPKELTKFAQKTENENQDLQKPLNFHVPMNLPELSAQFLSNFYGFLNKYPMLKCIFRI